MVVPVARRKDALRFLGSVAEMVSCNQGFDARSCSIPIMQLITSMPRAILGQSQAVGVVTIDCWKVSANRYNDAPSINTLEPTLLQNAINAPLPSHSMLFISSPQELNYRIFCSRDRKSVV